MKIIKVRAWSFILLISLIGFTCKEPEAPEILKPPITITEPEVPEILKPSITIKEPYAGIRWIAGSLSNIRWESSDFDGPVKIELFSGEAFCLSIFDSTLKQVISYYVPKKLEDRNDYSVKITSTTDGSIFEASDNFFISKFKVTEIDSTLLENRSSSFISNNNDYRIDINEDGIEELIFPFHYYEYPTYGKWSSKTIELREGFEVFTVTDTMKTLNFDCKPDEAKLVLIPKVFSKNDSVNIMEQSSNSAIFNYYFTNVTMALHGCPIVENVSAWKDLTDKFIVFANKENKTMGYVQLTIKNGGMHLTRIVILYNADFIKITE